MVMIPAMEVAATVSISFETEYRVTAARNTPKARVASSRVEVDRVSESERNSEV